MLLSTLNAATVPGDYVVAEYADYQSDYFQNTTPDYVSEMGKLAAAEMFSISSAKVEAKNIFLSNDTLVTEITLTGADQKKALIFRSMLRRRFIPTEVTNGPYELVHRVYPLSGKLCLDTYRRSESPT